MVVNLERLSETERSRYLENIRRIKKENVYFLLEEFTTAAEDFYKGNVADKSLFLKLGINLFTKRWRKMLARQQLGAASVYAEEAKSKGYSDLPEFKKVLDIYNTLSKKLRM